MSEFDPFGKGPHEGGVKMDLGKIMVDLMLRDFARALMAVAEVTTYGAAKYCPSGWTAVPNAVERYSDAKSRHLLKGHVDQFDEESGLAHAAHEAWNCLAVLELELRAKEQTNERYSNTED